MQFIVKGRVSIMIPCDPTPPFWWAWSLCSGCCTVLVFLDSGFWSRHWLIWCNEGIKSPFNWWQGSLFVWVGVLHIREGDNSSSLLLTWRVLTHYTSSCLILLTMTQFHEWLHWSWGSLSTGIYGQWHVIPSAKCTCSFQCLQPHHVTWGFHPSSVDAPVDVHGRSCNFLLIHPREVLLAGHWVTTLPLLSCGIIIISLPLEVSLHGVGLVHMSHAWQMHDTRECQPLTQWEQVSFGGGYVTFCIGPSLHKRGCLSWSDVPPHMYPFPTYPWSSTFP